MLCWRVNYATIWRLQNIPTSDRNSRENPLSLRAINILLEILTHWLVGDSCGSSELCSNKSNSCSSVNTLTCGKLAML